MKCTAIVVNFLREPYLFKCLESLNKIYPKMKIKVGENGEITEAKKKKVESFKNTKYHELSYDSGVCAGRNRLVGQVRTKYVLVGDDDFQYTEQSKVAEMIQFLESNPEYDLIGGRIRQDGEIKDYQGTFKFDNGTLKLNELDLENIKYDVCGKSGLRFAKSELVFNFFVARTKSVRKVKWDETIKIAYEHSSFFIEMLSAGQKVAFSPDPIVIHKPKLAEKINVDVYSKYRNRKSDKKRFFEKHEIHTLIDMQGRVDNLGGLEKFGGFDKIGETTFIIKTLKRRKSLEKLLFSIVKYYPEVKVLIGDDDDLFDVEYYKDLWQRLLNAGLKEKPTAYNLLPDCGLSEGRNILVGYCKTEYILLLDDDFVFTEQTDISKFKEVLENDPTIGVAGGLLKMNGNDVDFAGDFEWNERQLIYKKYKENWAFTKNKTKYTYTDFVLNFALFRKTVFNSVKWDRELKIAGEHTDFYLNLKESVWKVAFVPEVVAIHEPTSSPQYKKMRSRTEFTIKMFKKWGIKSTFYEKTGFVYEYDEESNSLKNYRK